MLPQNSIERSIWILTKTNTWPKPNVLGAFHHLFGKWFHAPKAFYRAQEVGSCTFLELAREKGSGLQDPKSKDLHLWSMENVFLVSHQ